MSDNDVGTVSCSECLQTQDVWCLDVALMLTLELISA